MSGNIIDGIVLTVYTGMVPQTVINKSSLDNIITMKLSITGMTIISLGLNLESSLTQIYYKLNGPLPIPESLEYEALAMLFTFDQTQDNITKIADITDVYVLWVIISTQNRDIIYANHTKIEALLKEELLHLKDRDIFNQPEYIPKLITMLYQNIVPNITLPQRAPDYAKNIIKKTLDYFTINSEGQLIELDSIERISSIDILILVNYINKSIFVIMMNDTITRRLRYLAMKAVSELNSKSLKLEFTVRNVTDELEKNFLIEKIIRINKELTGE